MTEQEKLMLIEDLGDSDWAFIINKEGQLKGMVVPEMNEEELVHENIIAVLSILDPDLAREIDEEYEKMIEEESLDDSNDDPTGQTIH